MRRFGVLASASFLMMSGSAAYADSLCSQCHEAAKHEFKQCMEAAISAEDKASCHEKHDAKSKSCEEGECRLEQAAKPGPKDKPVTGPLPDRK
ncbi:MAG: hypothetical protein P0111_17505 [Nitrospira sp.]|nr:hypothetical protein [Nitrospira sp.]